MSIVLVTGGAGYVGSHICKALSQAGHTPVSFDNFSRGHRDFVRWGPSIEGDVRNQSDVATVLTGHAIDAVIHCAALAYVGESHARPMAYYDANVNGTLSLLGAMREAGIGTVVLSSSCAVYGTPDKVPIAEDTALAPISPYGRSKWMAERLMQDCTRTYGLTGVALRYFNAAGADPDGEIGERHDPETHLIPNALLAAADPGRTLSVYGTDYNTPDGTAIRDYLHVTDLAAAHVRALNYAGHTQGFSAFNLGTGQGHSVRDTVACVERIARKAVRTQEKGRRAGDPAVLIAAPDLAREKLQWVPIRSDLETMVSDAWSFMNK